MDSSNPARSSSARKRSLLEEADARRKRVKLAGWILVGWVAVLMLVQLTAMTARELLVLFGAMVAAPPPASGTFDEDIVSVSNSAAIVSDKVCHGALLLLLLLYQ